MPETDIGRATIGDQESTENKFTVDTQILDNVTDQKETIFQNHNWSQQLGYYKDIPELKAAIDAKARWVIGKGFSSNEITEITLSAINGNGKDTFNSILQNLVRVYQIGGDSYAEIIRNEEGNLINLKPLDPGSMVIVANKAGLIIRYEQTTKIKDKKNKTFQPDQIFHLSRDRIGDEIHGVSVINAVEGTILARNEAIRDYRKLLRRNVYPVRIHHIDTDDKTEIDDYIAKADKAQWQGENFYIPKGIAEIEISAVPANATLNPLPWIQQLTQSFYQEVDVPQIIVGGAQEITEASAKIAYLAWEQTVEEEQLYVEEEVLLQLNLEIELEFPASLQNELLSDNRKDTESGAVSPEDTSVNNVGVNA